MMTETQQLLARFVASRSESAFRELVALYLDLVYSTAVRLVDGDRQRGEDVAQIVFADLARMAGKLAASTTLGGWLHRHTCFVARTVMRGERRRRAREREAVEMNTLNGQGDTVLAQVAPMLDEAINELGPDDREAILLRYFESRSLRSVGEVLGVTENVAQKRVARAVEELGTLLRRRGVVLSAGALASGLAAGVVTAAPAGLASSIASFCIGAGAAGGVGLGTAKLALATNLKLGIVGLMVVGVVATIFVQKAPREQPSQQPEAVLSQQPAPQAAPPTAGANEVARPAVVPRVVQARKEPAPSKPAPRLEPAPTEDHAVTAGPAPALAGPQTGGLAAAQTTTYSAVRGSKIWIEGTANFIHTAWYVGGDLIGGSLTVGPGFPTEPGQAATPGKTEAQANSFIPVGNLKSREKDGQLYSSHMDDVMYEHFKSDKYPQIKFKLTELALKEAAKSKDEPCVFDSKGQLTIGGITKEISMPVKVLPLEGKKLKISASLVIKMSDYQVGPVEKTVMNIGIKTGDEVKLTLDWMLKRRSNAEQRSAPPDPASHPPAASSQAARSELGPSP